MENVMILTLSFLIRARAHKRKISIKKSQLKWDLHTLQPIKGYYVYYGLSPGEYIEKILVRGKYNQPFYLRELPLKTNVLYYISITAFTINELSEEVESDYSNEVTFKQVPKPVSIYKCKHRHIGNDQRPRCYHTDNMGRECYISNIYKFPKHCPL